MVNLQGKEIGTVSKGDPYIEASPGAKLLKVRSRTMLAAELHDLALGQGEWRNLQQVIRKTFKLCIEKQHEQSQQIVNLSAQVNKMREELSQRPTWADVENMVTLRANHDKHLASYRSKQAGATSPSSSSHVQEVEELKLQVAQLRSECERRVTIQSLQNSLQRKADRSDLQALRESTSKVVDAPQDMSKLKLDIAEVRSEMENLQDQVEETKRGLAAKNTVVDLSIVKVQLEGLFRRVHEEMYNREEITSMLNQKISRSDAEKLLASKVESQTLSAVTTKIEDVLAEHERLITSLRLSASDPSLFSADFLSKKGPILPSAGTHSGGVSSHSDSDHHSFQHHRVPSSPSRPTASSASRRATSSSSSSSSSSAIGVLPGRTGIQDSKLESILSGLWNKMNAMIKEYKTIHAEHSQMRKELAAVKEQMSHVAAVEKMELLAVVVEEQRLRLDAVIQGSTKIYPIFKELKRMDTTIKEVEQFLSLPQPRRLHEHLQEMTSLMEDLSQRLVELSADVHTQQATKVETLLSRTDAIEARVESCLVDRERIGYLMDQVDVSDTRYTNVREIAQGLTELWNVLLNDQQTSHTPSLVSRVKSVETQLRANGDEHQAMQHRIELLKDAFSSYGLQVDQYQEEPPRHRHDRRATRDHRRPVSASRERPNSRTNSVDETEDTGGISPPPVAPPQQKMHVSEFENAPTTEEAAPTVAYASSRRNSPRRVTKVGLKRPTVDFDAAISSLYASLEDVAMPVRVPIGSPLRHRVMGINTARSASTSSSSHSRSPSPSAARSPTQSGDVMLMSITEVDERLAELQREKQRLRQLLISRV